MKSEFHRYTSCMYLDAMLYFVRMKRPAAHHFHTWDILAKEYVEGSFLNASFDLLANHKH